MRDWLPADRRAVIMPSMGTDATRRAVRDLLAHGPRPDLTLTIVGVEMGQHLEGGLTSDVGDGATPAELVLAIREECGDDALAYALLLEMVVVAGLDELQVLAGLTGELEPSTPAMPPAPPRRSAARRRRR